MTTRTQRPLLVGLFLLVLAFHVAVIWQDFSSLAKNGFLYDDSFYAFKIADNIASGNGISFDGIHITNGFQPLYVFLLVPVFWFAGSNLIAPVYGALALSALLTAVTAIVLYKIVRRYANETIALACSALWAFSPVVIRQSANGLETSLALFFFAVVIHFYLFRIRSVSAPRSRDFLTLGALVGLAVLARIDQVFLGCAILIDYLLLMRQRNAHTGELLRVLRGVLIAGLVYSPWFLYSAVVVGSVFQDSGTATRFLSIAYAPFFNLGPADLVTKGPDVAFLWGHVMHSLSVLKVAPPVHVFFRATEKLGIAMGLPGLITMLTNIVGLGILSYVVYRVVTAKVTAALRDFRFLLIFGVLFVATYSLYVFGLFFFIRYFYPIYFVACLLCAVFVQELAGKVRIRGRSLRMATAMSLSAYALAFAFMSYTSGFRAYVVYNFYDVARWVDDNTRPDEIVGVFQGGAVGYLSERRVVNLDGKVNQGALAALKSGELREYLDQEKIDVVLDNTEVLDLFLDVSTSQDAEPILIGSTEIMRGSRNPVVGWSAFRFGRDVGAAESGVSPTRTSSGKP